LAFDHFIALDCIDYQLVLSSEDAKRDKSSSARMVTIEKDIVSGGAAARRGHLALFPGKGGAATVWKLGDL